MLYVVVEDEDDKEDFGKFGLSPAVSTASGFFMLVAPEAELMRNIHLSWINPLWSSLASELMD